MSDLCYVDCLFILLRITKTVLFSHLDNSKVLVDRLENS